MFYALMGSPVSVKQSAKQAPEAQAALEAALAGVNERYEDNIAERFSAEAGCGCRGLMRSSGDPTAAALTIMHRMRPFGIRFAIGAGGTEAEAVDRARRKLGSMQVKHGARLRFAFEEAELETRLNTIAALCDKLASQWTDKQELAVFTLLMSRLSGARLTQSELARLFGVGQSTVNEQLAAAGFNEYCAGILYIKQTLAELQ